MSEEAKDLSVYFVCQKNIQSFDYLMDKDCEKILENFRTENMITAGHTKNYLVMLCNLGTNDRITEMQLDLDITINHSNRFQFKKKYHEFRPKPIVLGDISWANSIIVSIDRLDFQKNGVWSDNYESNAPVHGNIVELNINYGFKDEDELENYYLLSNYYNNSINSRGLLLNLMFQIAKDFLNTKTLQLKGKKFTYSEKDVPFVSHTLQIDIVAKIMMYVEDLVTIMEANRLCRNYYDLLDKQIEGDVEIDLGDRLGNFFMNLNNFTLDEWIRMIGYIPREEMSRIKNSEVINKIIENNINQVKVVLKHIQSFGSSHHRIFRRYKHAGFPARFDGQFPLSPFGSGVTFDSYAAIYVGKNPLTDLTILPFSKAVLESYEILLPGLQFLIKDIIMNKMKSIMRRTNGIIPTEIYGDPRKNNEDEKSKYNEALVTFYNENPNRVFDIGLVNEANNSYLAEMSWYINFDRNMTAWKKNKEEADTFSSRT